MSHELNLDAIDVDGAVRETAAEAMDALDGDTRSQFLKRAGIAGGAVMGGGAVLGALAPNAFALGGGRPPKSVFGTGDVAILRFALTLEYLEASFYNEATAKQRKNAFISNSQLRVFLRAVTDDENQHVAALKSILGRKALKKPVFNFGGDTGDEKKFMTAAFAFENEGVHAYSGQAFNIKNPKILAAALSIVTIEARHASVIGLIRNGTTFGISPDNAFDTPFTGPKVVSDVTGLKADNGKPYVRKIYPA